VILVLGVGLIVSPDKMTVDQLGLGYKANNATSVAVAILVCYVGGILIMGGETKQWRLFAKIALAVGIVGSLVSQGRGGWVAAAAGILYLLWASKRPRAAIGLAIASLLLSVVSYRVFPQVEQRMNATVAQPNNAFGSAERNIAGINDGERTAIWMGNVGRVFDHPVLGTGLYHRGGLSGLPWYGSHNFFLQMFLETGLIGGGFILAAFARMWVDAGARANRRERMGVALRAALIAAFVGSMGGEYLYGGQVLLALLLVYAPTGAMPKKILSPALRWIRVNQPIAYQQANTLQR
jgi:O-antigen ligase